MSDTASHGRAPGRRGSVARVSTIAAIVRELVDDILVGTLPAGTPLPEVELANRFGVSRQSLRAALAELVFRGLVEREAHHSGCVATMSKRDAMDIYRMRQILEGEAVRWLARQPDAWPAMDDALELFRRLPADARWSQIAEADVAYHGATVTAMGSPRLVRLHNQLLDEMRLILVPAQNYVTRSEMLAEHVALLDVIKQGDPDRAVARLVEHLALGTDSLLRYLPEP